MSNEREAAGDGAYQPTKGASGWRVIAFDRLARPPEWLAGGVYVIATLGVLFVIYMLGLGLIAFFRLGHEIAFPPSTAPVLPIGTIFPKGDGTSSLTIFFTVLGALIGGPLLIWRVITAHIQAQATRHQAETGREAHYTSLFTRAVEQLGATREVKEIVEVAGQRGTVRREATARTEPNLEVRLGAIYALERIARDSERDHWPIMEVLSAYVRAHSGNAVSDFEGDPEEMDEYPKWAQSIGEPNTDIQAILTVIGRRRAERIQYEHAQGLMIDLKGVNLQKMRFKNMNLSNVDFSDAALHLTRFTDCIVRNGRFWGCHLQSTVLSRSIFQDCEISSCNLTGAVSIDTVVARTEINATNWSDATFMNTDFFLSHGYKIDFSKSKFNSFVTRCVWEEIDFSESSVARMLFKECFLTDIDFVAANDSESISTDRFFDTYAHYLVSLPEEVVLPEMPEDWEPPEQRMDANARWEFYRAAVQHRPIE